MRKLFLIAFAGLILAATLASQARIFADGTGSPVCPQKKDGCKP